jgi:hypothetical protein
MIGTHTLEAIATMPAITKQNLGILLGDSPCYTLSFPPSMLVQCEGRF